MHRVIGFEMTYYFQIFSQQYSAGMTDEISQGKKILEGEISNEWLEKDIEHLITFSILDDFAQVS